jgi:hypothetical protein
MGDRHGRKSLLTFFFVKDGQRAWGSIGLEAINERTEMGWHGKGGYNTED